MSLQNRAGQAGRNGAICPASVSGRCCRERITHGGQLYGIPVDDPGAIRYLTDMTPRAFEWDDAKAASNLAKHGVPFDYATRVFLDVAVVDFNASREADGEARRKAVGLIEGRVLRSSMSSAAKR